MVKDMLPVTRDMHSSRVPPSQTSVPERCRSSQNGYLLAHAHTALSHPHPEGKIGPLIEITCPLTAQTHRCRTHSLLLSLLPWVRYEPFSIG